MATYATGWHYHEYSSTSGTTHRAATYAAARKIADYITSTTPGATAAIIDDRNSAELLRRGRFGGAVGGSGDWLIRVASPTAYRTRCQGCCNPEWDQTVRLIT